MNVQFLHLEPTSVDSQITYKYENTKKSYSAIITSIFNNVTMQ